jgi:MscS family membrane protein
MKQFILLLSTIPTTALAAETGLINSLVSAFPAWTREAYLTLTVWQWIGISGAILIGIIARFIVNIVLKVFLRFVKNRTATKWDDLIVEAFIGPAGMLLAVLIWYSSIFILSLAESASHILIFLLQIILSISLIFLAYRLINVFIEFLHGLALKTASDLDDQLMPVIDKTLRFLVLSIGSLIALQNIGVNVVSALAGLGIGGLAFALAAKDTAANMFGSLTIFLDQPFKMGDWVLINGVHEGVVEAIGVRTTRIRTFGKTLISLPNAVVANSSIENISRRPYRRVKTTLGLTYNSKREQIEAVLVDIRSAILANKYTIEDNMHVNFIGYGPSSLDIFIYFFVKVASWDEELEAKEGVMLDIMNVVEKHSLEFAFPTQTVHIESMPKD